MAKKKNKKVKIQHLNCVPYQGCPLCNGSVFTLINSMTRALYDICSVCNGDKIIPMRVVVRVTKLEIESNAVA